MPTSSPNSPGADPSPGEQLPLLPIIESAMDAIITVDDQQRVVLFNAAAERVFGVPAREALGASLDQFIPAKYRGAHGAHIRKFGEAGATTRTMGRLGTLHGLRRDGKEFPIEASISHATIGGRMYFTVILRDISDKQRLESQLLQSQKMEGIGRLAGGVAHDFNNMLMAIFNFIELAARNLPTEHPSRASLQGAKDAADRAATLTRQLLLFARKQTASPRVVRAGEVVGGLETMLRRLLGADLSVRFSISPDTGHVRADPSQVEQVLMNLAVNARDAMPRGGTLTIESGNIALDEDYCKSRVGATPGEHVVIAVTDTGTGMSPEVQARLFEPFFTTKPVGKGTGLGLATCHGIIKQCGGHIAVYSEVGHGTCVRILLPRVREGADAAKVAEPAPAPAGGSETILLAEDSEMVRQLAVDALRGAGYVVLVGENGTQALDAANAHAGPIHLLVADVVMPEMSGVQLAEALSKSRPGTRVIFMSGYTSETVPIQDAISGPREFLSKPFMMADLLRKVREVLDAGRAAR